MLTGILAFILDTIIGDPNSKWHPVVLIGRLIAALERLFYREMTMTARNLSWVRCWCL